MRVQKTAKLILVGFLLLVVVVAGTRSLGGFYHSASLDVRSALREGQVVNAVALREAERKLLRSTALWPFDILVWDDLGVIYLNLFSGASAGGEQGASVEYLEKAKRVYTHLNSLAPTYGPGWARKSIVLEQMGMQVDSIMAMEQSVAVGPYHPWTTRMRLLWAARNWSFLDEELQDQVLAEAQQSLRYLKRDQFLEDWFLSSPPDLQYRLITKFSGRDRAALLVILLKNRNK